MTKKRSGDAWMPAPQYARTLEGLTLNLLVRDISLALPFHREVLRAKLIYSDPDIAVLGHQNSEWMLHADHTYDVHPIHAALEKVTSRGLGAELRGEGAGVDLIDFSRVRAANDSRTLAAKSQLGQLRHLSTRRISETILGGRLIQVLPDVI